MMEEEQDIIIAKRLHESDDWKWAKSKLETMVEIYRNANLAGTDTAVGREYKRRKDVASLVMSLFDYVEGTAQIPPEVSDTNASIKRF